MSSDPVELGNAVSVGSYTGPADDFGTDRRRWQLSVIHPDTGERQIVQLDAAQMDSIALKLSLAPGYPR